MHAFLVQSTNLQICKSQIEKQAEKLHAKILNYPIKKIDDVRSLNNLIRLTVIEPTLVVCENIHEAGVEALNAFLKNLEEPQENLYFILTAPSIRKVLPTIVSRCQIIKSTNIPIDKSTNDAETEKFLNMTTGEKLAYVDKIKDRNIAIELVVNSINLLHGKLHSGELKYTTIINNVSLALETLTRLKGNGNVNLQLTNFVIQYGNMITYER